MSRLDVAAIRRDFPILDRSVNGKPLVYLDNAATSQKPRRVIEAITRYYEETNANVHRGLHKLSEEATDRYEAARATVGRFIGASDPESIVFTHNSTHALNIAALGWGMKHVGPDDTIVLTEMEHHANLVPWQMVARETGARLRYVQMSLDGRLDMEDFRAAMDVGPKVAAFTHASNVLGTVNPVLEMTRLAREAGALVVIDGSQAVPHFPVDVAEIGCDFYAFTGHKMCGPTGIGALYGKPERLEETEPVLFGGSMISRVRWESSEWNIPPHRFEAGTPNIEGALGLAVACDYLAEIGMDRVALHEREICDHGLGVISGETDLTIHGPLDTRDRLAIFSFTVRGVHPHDVSQIVDQAGVAVRAGHHCCEPLHRKLGVQGSVRAGAYLYNNPSDFDALIGALDRVRKVFSLVG